MRTRLARRLRPLLAVVAVAGLAVAAWSQHDAIAAFDWSIDRWQLALSVALFAVAPLLQALTFVVGLRRVGADGPTRGLVRVWARSFLLRYEPSGAVGFVYRVTARERMGASTAQVLTVTGYEQLAAVVAGAVAAMAGFVGAGIDPPVISVVLFVGALLAALAARSRSVIGWLNDRLSARGIETAGPLRTRTLALMISLDAIGWITTGLGAWTLARALHATGGLDAFLLLGAFALSWLLGVLVPLAPGGLGLREGSLIVSLTASVGAGVATGLALALRLV
ncbi:MAG TPA: lysylphosphatidylglycerol synthase domain-containing protein, partial [Solirubrobacteraceae bacterium]|nr:lysylphosphatidylglycerol synthase domain-containing protein [Solirubrobacteraceae bacterium]